MKQNQYKDLIIEKKYIYFRKINQNIMSNFNLY